MFIKFKSKGLTLTEVIFAVFILVVALSAILTTFVVGKMSVSRARHKIEARNLLGAKMEQLKNTSYENIISSAPVTITLDKGPDITEGTADDLLAEQSVWVLDKNGYKEIIVKLSWNEIGWGGSIAAYEKLVTFINVWSKYHI